MFFFVGINFNQWHPFFSKPYSQMEPYTTYLMEILVREILIVVMRHFCSEVWTLHWFMRSLDRPWLCRSKRRVARKRRQLKLVQLKLMAFKSQHFQSVHCLGTRYPFLDTEVSGSLLPRRSFWPSGMPLRMGLSQRRFPFTQPSYDQHYPT